MFTFEKARSEKPDNITFWLKNVITERIIFVSRGITLHYVVWQVAKEFRSGRDRAQKSGPPTV